MSSNDLTDLKQKRLKWVEANRENGFDEGINRLLTELYPDNAHFIYELLQNAEDPQATEVTFKLTDSAVEFSHNGKRLFEFKDVESITSIGNSTKRDDATSIGKFGVGFKAVFAYTNTPEIHSGDFHFQIHDLVVPETKGVEQSIENQTRFVFPFDNPKKLSVLAASEVEKGLCALGDNTLLFLSHIRKINYSLPDGSQGSLERLDHENGRIEIRAKHPHSEETISHWLHFHKDVEVTDSDGNNKNCRVAIAYQLEKAIDKNKNSEIWKIVPIRGQVSIYFPAEKETSELKFHIHAPFASTVARDSVRDCADNEQLRDHIAALIVESFSIIRDEELLTMNFLAVLPNPKNEQLSLFYERIRRKIVRAFIKEKLTPTKNGSYESSHWLYRGLSKISNVIDEKDLFVLTGKSYAQWAANPSQLNSREDNFLDSLQMSKWNFDELLTAFHELPFSSETYDSDYQKWREANTIRQENLKFWFEQKDDEWLMRFYALLNDAPKQSDWASLNFRLVRIEADGEIKHVKANNAYFAPLHENISTDGVNIVKRETYVKDNSKQDIDENAEQFLEKIGVKPFDETAALKLLLENRYRKYPKWDSYDYYADIKQIVRYWKENISKSWWKTSEILEIENLFKTEKFLLGTKKDGDGKITSHWLTASDICLDDSYFETGLAKLTHVHQKSPIWYNYKNKLNENELADFVEFLKFIGVMYKLEVIERFFHSSSANENPNNPHKDKNYNGEGRDYDIPNLVQYIATKTEIASRIIWNTLINASGTVKTASFKPNRKPEARFDSLLITVLKNRAWILGKDGYLYPPKAITRDDLPDNFPFNNSNGLLTAIEFGKNAKDNEERERRLQEQTNSNFKQRDIFAKELGAESVDEAEEAIKFLYEMKSQGKTLAEIRDILNPKKPDFEDDYSSNPERRAGKIQETAVYAPEKRTEMRERSVAVDNTETKKAAKSYLRDRYTDDDKILYCQICKKEMPFKLSDGSYYFEVVQLIGDTQKRYKENYIALCPTDAAKFQYANPSKDNISDLVSALLDDRSPDDINDSDEDENCFDIVLAGNTETVQFRRVHLIDLKAILSNK